MESVANQLLKEKQKKEALRRQIALLQSQLSDEEQSFPVSPRQKSSTHGVLVPRTPSPRKRRKLEDPPLSSARNVSSAVRTKQNNDIRAEQNDHIPSKPLPSKLVQRLSRLHSEEASASSKAVQRTSSFTDKPPEPGSSKRDENLAIIETLELGPAEHKPPFDDPHFERVEPNSGIRLKSRILPHEDLQDHLRGRYYLSPSRLYSSISLTADKTGYDVPVDGDWITIAVVAERGPIKYTNPPVGIAKEEEADEEGKPSADQGRDKDKGNRKNKKSTSKSDHPNPRRRYVNVKLIDFGSRTSSSNTTKGHIRGDAFLTLLLFEAEAIDLLTQEYGQKLARPKKVYRGGSGGAFEAMAKLKEGDVIALLNPRIMKPFTNSSTSTPHPVHNILAVTPTNASSITHIGRSLDLGMCMVQKRDGSTCGSWCDKRISNVCEWHVINAVQRRRAARSEFAVGTSGMTNSAVVRSKSNSNWSNYDPVRKTGLLPQDGPSKHKFGGSTSYASEATYVLSGHVVNSSNTVDTMHVSEQMGREGQARAQRADMRTQEDELLKKMLKKERANGLDGGEGHVKSVLKAKEVIEKAKKEKESKSIEKGKKSKKKDLRGKRKRHSQESENSDGSDREMEVKRLEKQSTVSRYRPEMIKTLGFDPVAMKLGPQRQSNSDVQRKLADLAALQKSRKEINLGPRPGAKIRSGVFKPAIEPARFENTRTSTDVEMAEQNSDATTDGPGERMVDLDSSDGE
ncbi:hypothetical protein J3R30DRAFT_3462472 [Lentinula aciculospora]|uniref:Zinc finger Mcm10/DnaG-type domain-containing protein n=1 Tax=Lentinula aciculospora TaxID=153920 RepID=A0A9W9DQD5_9AGAR|nr:hypothetical protein J3R30DRAFT_3462472 [Lentinula aciculospora]